MNIWEWGVEIILNSRKKAQEAQDRVMKTEVDIFELCDQTEPVNNFWTLIEKNY